ncbi:Uncharacterised protein [Mycobacteroides abscessus]|nr:Uncharacterised protein [Mycobacteroides abscessus]
MRRRLSRAFVTLVVVVLTGPVIALIMWPTVLVYRNTGDPALAALAQVAYLAAPYAVYLGVRGAGWALRRLGEAMVRRRDEAQVAKVRKAIRARRDRRDARSRFREVCGGPHA